MASSSQLQNYISIEEVEDGLKNKTLIKGIITFVRYDNNGFVAHIKRKKNLIFKNYVDANCALELDVVIARKKYTTDDDSEKEHMVVVHILEKVHRRTAIGLLKPPLAGKSFTFLTDRSRTLPYMEIPMSSWPTGFASFPEEYENKLIEAEILYWLDTNKTFGQALQVLGPCGDIQVENLALAKEFCLEQPKMTQKSKNNPKDTKNKKLKDNSLVFSVIDTRTNSVNIAFSCCSLTEDTFKISVHISNVAYFLKSDTDLTDYIAKRSATIWLQDVIYQMMPCEFHKQCCLTPGQNRLVVSITFLISKSGEVLETKFEQSLINPCAILTIDQIDDISRGVFSEDIDILNGYTKECLSESIDNMTIVAKALKHQQKLKNITCCYHLVFDVDKNSREPSNMRVIDVNTVKEMFKQFIFLTNCAVGEFIFNKFPNLAILKVKNHPNRIPLSILQEILQLSGSLVDVTLSQSLESDLEKCIQESNAGDNQKSLMKYLFAKCRRKQRYVCSDGYTKESLSFDGFGQEIYARITSPLDKYTDIVVQQLVLAAINNTEPLWDAESIKTVIDYTEGKELQAKRAAKANSELYTLSYFATTRPFSNDAIVYNVAQNWFDALLINTSTTIRIYQKHCTDSIWKPEKIEIPDRRTQWKINIEFKSNRKVILIVEVLQTVKVKLYVEQYNGNLKLRPKLLQQS